ncbi:MAG: hypothetical protein P8Y98_02420 [Anaerolineales bacterium]
MRQHKLGLCEEHFLDWIPQQTQRFIEKYGMFTKDDRILVAISGGKDSLSLWDVLVRLGYHADGLYINLGIDDGTQYSSKSKRFAEDFAETNKLQLLSVATESSEGFTIPEASRRTLRGQDRPCSVCGLTKRHILNRVAREKNYDVLVTGMSLRSGGNITLLQGTTQQHGRQATGCETVFPALLLASERIRIHHRRQLC